MRANTFPQLALPARRAYDCARCRRHSDMGLPAGAYWVGDSDHALCNACADRLNGRLSELALSWPPLAGTRKTTPTPFTEYVHDEPMPPRLGLCAATVSDLQIALSVAGGRLQELLRLLADSEADPTRSRDLAGKVHRDLENALWEWQGETSPECVVCGYVEYDSATHDGDPFVDDGQSIPLHTGCCGRTTPGGSLAGQCDSCDGYAIGLRPRAGSQWVECPECAEDREEVAA